MGDETPAIGGHGAPILALDDDERVIGRSHVVAGPELIGGRFGGEDLGELGRRPLLREPSAHAGKSSIVRPMDDARPPASPDPARTGRLTAEGASAPLAGGGARPRPRDLPAARTR